MDGTEADLRELIASARRGDRAAQGELFLRYRTYLALLARLSLSRRLRGKLDASDIVQDVFANAHTGFPGFRGDTPEELVGWFKQILANRLADLNRRFVDNQRRQVGRERSLEQIVEHSSRALGNLPPARGTSPSAGAHRREVGVLVADALAGLKDDDREVIVLKSLEERDWDEVARLMGRTKDAVRALWSRALQRLGDVLEEKRWTAP
jgi:RNA polymerase sigma-70 factor (ECF subfamily)